MTEDRRRKLDDIGFQWVVVDRSDNIAIPWEESYANLKKFRDTHGHCNVPKKENFLYGWVDRQKKLKRKGKLLQDRVEKLENLGIQWTPLRDLWEDRYSELKEFYRIHGHCNVPNDKSGLHFWVRSQKSRHKQKTLDGEHVALLEELGIKWLNPDENSKEFTSPNINNWDEMYLELKRFKETHGHCDVNQRIEPWERLGEWANAQRRKKRRTGDLTEDQIKKLEEINFK